MKASQAERNAKGEAHQEKADAKIGTSIHSVRSDLDETIQRRMEDVLLRLDHKTQGLHTELSEGNEKTQVELQASRVVPRWAE
jgi:hypothetical protein